MQKEYSASGKAFSILCPNCHIQITPETQICFNCNTRICTYCHGAIPSYTSTVCPNCGKHDFLSKSIKDIRMETQQRQQSAQSFATETGYKCPICNEKMVLIPGGTLKCQSRSCGYLVALKEFLNNPDKPLTAAMPPTDVPKGTDRPQKEKSNAVSWQRHTTSVETKAADQYFWKKERLPKKQVGIYQSKMNRKTIIAIVIAVIAVIIIAGIVIFFKLRI